MNIVRIFLLFALLHFEVFAQSSLKISDLETVPGEIEVSITGKNILNVAAISIHILYDSKLFELIKVESVLPDFNFNSTGEKILINWVDFTTSNPISFEDAEIFRLVLDYNGTNTTLAFDEISTLIVNPDIQPIVVDLLDGQITDLTTDLDEKESGANIFILYQNYPNPFNPSTTIYYSITEGAEITVIPKIVSINVFNPLGRKISTLVNKYQLPGNYSVVFDASGLSSGVYIYELKHGNFHQSKKMIFIR